MNIIKLQDELRGVPDNALIGYVQNPTGHVPSYLALSELQRRKDMRAKYQQQQAPESSVADDLEQETTPQPQAQGVASLPVPETMYQEDNFASGGIVSFAGPQGSYVSSDPRPYYYGENEEEVTSPLGRLFNYLDISGQVKKSDFGKRREERKKLDEQIQETVPTLIGGKRGFFDQETKAQQREYDQRRRELKDQKDKSPFFAPEPGGFVYDKKEVIDPAMKSYKEQELAKDKKQVKYGDKPAITKDAATQAPKQTTQQSEGSYEDALRSRMAIYKEFMGGDEDKKGLKDKLDKMEARAARQEELAPWMALTEAGFKTMQGTSPYALSNFGAGAEAGIKSYGGAQDKMAALEEKRYALMNEAAKADRAEKQAGIQFGENSYQHKAAMDQKERLGQAELEVKREANRLTASYNTARIGALTTGKTTNAMAALIQKTNAPLDKRLASLVMAGGKSKEIQNMIKDLEAKKLANENKIRAFFTQDDLAGTETPATNADPLGLL